MNKKWNQRLLQTPSEVLPVYNSLVRRDAEGKGLANTPPINGDYNLGLNTSAVKALLAERKTHEYSSIRPTPYLEIGGAGAISFRSPNTLLVGGYLSGESALFSIPLSTLSGWSKLTLPDSAGFMVGLTDAHTQGNTTIVVGRNGMWRSVGATTFNKGPTLYGTGQEGDLVTLQPLAVTYGNSAWYLAAYGVSGFPYAGVAGIFKSTDDGVTWTNVVTQNTLSNVAVGNARAAILVDGNLILAKVNERIFRTTSTTFTTVNRPEITSGVNVFFGCMSKLNNNTYCTSYEISYDAGITWYPFRKSTAMMPTSSASNGNIILFTSTSTRFPLVFGLGDTEVADVPNSVIDPDQLMPRRIKYFAEIDTWVGVGNPLEISGIGGVSLLSTAPQKEWRDYDVFNDFYNSYRGFGL